MTDNIWAWALPASVGDNDDADATINFRENQNPDTVNNSARAVMARVREFIADATELKATAGTGAAYTVTATQQPASLPNGFTVYLLPHATNTGTCTLNVNGLGAKPLRLTSASNAAAGDIVSNKPIHATYYETGDEFLVDAANTSGALSSSGGTLTGTMRWAKGADVASATALSLGTDGNSFDVTGTTAIESIDSLGVGTIVVLQFDDALTLTHDANDLILPGSANITTAAGDVAIMWEYAAGDWKCIAFEPQSGESVYDPDYALLDTAQTFTASQRGTVTALTSSSASIAVDFAASNNFSHTTTEDTTLANPSNIVAGQHGSIVITQDATTPRTMLFGSYWKNAGGTDDTLTATASAIDQINYYVKSSTEIHYNMIKAIS